MDIVGVAYSANLTLRNVCFRDMFLAEYIFHRKCSQSTQDAYLREATTFRPLS